jgi:structural maintenance of chromosome 3 (chondroitin sulfate proteoglycan 6)
VDAIYNRAVDVVAGNSLFHIVVDSDDTATKILAVLNKEKAGRVTFMPLNRIRPRPVTTGQLDQGVVRMLDKLVFEDKFEGVFRQVFGKAVVCRDLDIADTCARGHGFTAVTLDGDRVGKKGELSGGWEGRRSRIETIVALRKAQTDMDQVKDAFEEISGQVERVDQAITRLRDASSKIERERRGIIDSRERVDAQVEGLAREEIRLAELVSQKSASLAIIEQALVNSEMHIQAYQTELITKMTSGLDARERARVGEIQEQVGGMETRFERISGERVEMQEKVNITRVELSENLMRRRADISARIEAAQASNDTPEMNGREQELNSADARLEIVAKRIEAIEGESVQGAEGLQGMQQELENLKVYIMS